VLQLHAHISVVSGSCDACAKGCLVKAFAAASRRISSPAAASLALASGTHSDSDKLRDLGILLFRMAATTAIAGRHQLLCQTMPVGGNIITHYIAVYVE
jgi:hypothetical protein